MRVFAVSDIRDSSVTFRGTWVYRDFFHGDAGAVVNRYGHRPYQSLPLRRNTVLLPPVFFAGISLVVNESIAHELACLDSIDVNPCSWEGVYEYPVDATSVTNLMQRFSPLDDEHGDWIQGRLRPPYPAVEQIKYYEVICPLLVNLQLSFQCDREFKLPSPAYGQSPLLRTTHRLHALYPVVKFTPYLLLLDSAFRTIEKHVQDSELFTVRCLDV
jgi:hypothetical protein